MLDTNMEYFPYKMSAAEKALYDPSTKGDAIWYGTEMHTADGWVCVEGPFDRHWYEQIKGIDLVRYFTESYLVEKARAAEKRKKKIHQMENPLLIPNPRPRHQNKRGKQYRSRKNKPHSPLLALPGEIRTQIYSYALSDARILIKGSQPNKELAALKSTWTFCDEHVDRPRYRLSCLIDNYDLQDGLEVSTALLLVCKSVKNETQQMLYSKLTFCFDSMKVINIFLDRTPKLAVKAINKLELSHIGYSATASPDSKGFKQIHDAKWDGACERIAREMPALSSLKLNIKVADEDLGYSSQWWRTLSKLRMNGQLDNVEVSLSHKAISKDRMARASLRLKDSMLSEKGMAVRSEKRAILKIRQYYEMEEAAEALARARVEAARVEKLKLSKQSQPLKIMKIVDVQNKQQALATAVKRYYTSNLGGYAREDVYGSSWGF